jgi:hypothetical protein
VHGLACHGDARWISCIYGKRDAYDDGARAGDTSELTAASATSTAVHVAHGIGRVPRASDRNLLLEPRVSPETRSRLDNRTSGGLALCVLVQQRLQHASGFGGAQFIGAESKQRHWGVFLHWHRDA